MVLSGQDKWRKHPLLTGQWKRPLPGLGIAAALFAVYVVAETGYNYFIAPPAHSPHDRKGGGHH